MVLIRQGIQRGLPSPQVSDSVNSKGEFFNDNQQPISQIQLLRQQCLAVPAARLVGASKIDNLWLLSG